ncbi:MAG: hypothetical protein KJO82_12190 [Gammaproteobacteria bacterium]|nr:hypothetical protein [Gammaproteobacteria bacterium]
MFRIFIVGIVLGAISGFAALYYVPIVDQYREQSIVSVLPNGGNAESFHVNVPIDRIMVGAPSRSNSLPPGLEWPANELYADARVELFKIRNSKDAVVGVASRMAATDTTPGVIEWVLHLPARGSVFLTMQPDAVDGGYRVGELRAGTREFGSLRGSVSERWIADASAAGDATAGRIELVTAFIGTEVYIDESLDLPRDEDQP